MLAPVSRIRKTGDRGIIWLSRHRCKHGHTYLEHYNCFLKERKPDEKIGFFDIEASNLKANAGIMLSYCIKEHGKNKTYLKSITRKEALGKDLDKNIVSQCIKDLSKFDRIVTYYGTGFDYLFVRTRAARWKLDFPIFGEQYHDDIYYIVRNKFCLTRNSMENACRVLLGSTEKTHYDPEVWLRATQGNEKALAGILDHCKRDVRDLERLYNYVINFKSETFRSI